MKNNEKNTIKTYFMVHIHREDQAKLITPKKDNN